jgi:hypothetical protein
LIKHGVIFGLLLFLLYINELLQFVNNKSTPILFANDTSNLFTHSNTTELNSNTYTVFETVNTLFKNSYLSLNLKKNRHCVHFKTRNSPAIDIKTGYNKKLIPSVLSTKFLGYNYFMHVIMENAYKSTTLSTACYVIRFIKPLMYHKTLILIYYSLVHIVLSHGIIF